MHNRRDCSTGSTQERVLAGLPIKTKVLSCEGWGGGALVLVPAGGRCRGMLRLLHDVGDVLCRLQVQATRVSSWITGGRETPRVPISAA